MDTKVLILKAALELYNNKGIKRITTRHIATEVGISHGNLHYHFKHTDDLILTLYQNLAAKFDTVIAQLKINDCISFSTIREFSISSFELIYDYRFIFLHFVEIGLRIESIKKDYYCLMQRRTEQFLFIFKKLVENDVFREDLTEANYTLLITQIFIVGDFWLSHNELTLQLQKKEAIEHYHNIFLNMFFPYLKIPK